MVKRSAGVWGPLGFAAAAVTAARRQPAYSHREDHVSGLAATGEASARAMVPGFVVLAVAQSVLAAPSSTLRRIVRAASVTTLAAGLIRVSDPSCPQPGVDDHATMSDLGHGAASIATFGLWASMPVVAARDERVPGWYRRTAFLMRLPTAVAFVLAGATTAAKSSSKGLAQRTFLATVFVMLAATGLASPRN